MRLYLDYSYRDFEEGDEHELTHVSIDEDGRIDLFIRYGEESWFTPADWYDSWDEAFEYFELVESETA